MTSKPNITSHSFRIGYITQLWKDFKDIEFIETRIDNSAGPAPITVDLVNPTDPSLPNSKK